MKPDFPMIQIDTPVWDVQLMSELLIFDHYYYSNDDRFYRNYVFKKRFLSSNGRVYVAGEKIREKDFLSRLGFRSKYKILFEPTEEYWTFHGAQQFFYFRIENMDEQYARKNWLKSIDHATNIKELIEAKEI